MTDHRTRAPRASHDWVPVTRVQTPPRVRCSRCGQVRRWSVVEDRYHYYSGATGAFVGSRPGPCSTTREDAEL